MVKSNRNRWIPHKARYRIHSRARIYSSDNCTRHRPHTVIELFLYGLRHLPVDHYSGSDGIGDATEFESFITPLPVGNDSRSGEGHRQPFTYLTGYTVWLNNPKDIVLLYHVQLTTTPLIPSTVNNIYSKWQVSNRLNNTYRHYSYIISCIFMHNSCIFIHNLDSRWRWTLIRQL